MVYRETPETIITGTRDTAIRKINVPNTNIHTKKKKKSNNNTIFNTSKKSS